MTKNEDILNPFEVTERERLAVQNKVDTNKYLTIIFFTQHYTQLDTCPKCGNLYFSCPKLFNTFSHIYTSFFCINAFIQSLHISTCKHIDAKL